jgi:ABC-type polysaccharide/polyol phosphate transport system ATPase subunit
MKAPPVSISCKDLSLRFPVYGVDAKSLKKHLAKITVGGRLGRHHGSTEVTALSNLNLELKAGDRLGLVGHNGSGKTTLLRALSGAYEPDEGSIEVQGHIAPCSTSTWASTRPPPATTTSACAAASPGCRRRKSTGEWTRSPTSPASGRSSPCR